MREIWKKNLKDFIEIGRQYFEEEEGLRFLEWCNQVFIQCTGNSGRAGNRNNKRDIGRRR